jgi:uncharacterized protein (TIGR00255 family)
MVYSMTGFGSGEATINGIGYRVELKALNSKGLDLNIKLPAALKSLEAFVRQSLMLLNRGKIDCIIFESASSHHAAAKLNISLLELYFKQISQFAVEKNLSTDGILPALLQMPGVVGDDTPLEPEEAVAGLGEMMEAAISQLNTYRIDEGQSLQKDLRERIATIRSLMADILPFEVARVPRVKERILQTLKQLSAELPADEGRLEIEMVFYADKFDISEERTRLAIHCDYFEQELSDANRMEKGKKLGFIVQEMGREVNTIGSKANDANIQQMVVLMKDEMEKIKEQVSNIL